MEVLFQKGSYSKRSQCEIYLDQARKFSHGSHSSEDSRRRQWTCPTSHQWATTKYTRRVVAKPFGKRLEPTRCVLHAHESPLRPADMELTNPARAWRRLRQTAEYPPCNTDMSHWPPEQVANCSFLNYKTAVMYLIRLCNTNSCLQLTSIMKTDNPQECDRYGNSGNFLLYRDFLNPLDETCSQINTQKTADPLSPATTTPPAVASTPPRSPTKTSQSATTASISKMPSAGGTDSSQDGESTPTPPDLSPTASTSLSPRVSSSATPTVETSSHTPSPFPRSSSSSSAELPSQPPPSQSPDPTQSVSDYLATTESPDRTRGDFSAASNAASSPTARIACVVVGAVVFIAILSILFKRKASRRAPHSTAKKDQLLVTNTTHESATAPQEDMTESYNKLVALNNWRIDSSDLVDGRLLGCGSQGAVYLVRLDGGRCLASKRLVKDHLTKQRLNSVIVELELVAKLKHPNIVQFVGVAWTTPSDFQALFEYMANGDLRTHLDQTKPSQHQPQPQPWTSEKLKVAIQIAQALVYVHSFNPPVVHRDIKARNVLLDDEMNAKLSDFGASRSLSEQATMTTGVGTSRWLAPEVIMGGGKYTEQCDIYSFGVLLVEMDSHAIPFSNEELPDIELLHRVATGTLRPTLSAACDPLLRELILQCLSVEPSARPNALELAYRLRKIMKSFVPE